MTTRTRLATVLAVSAMLLAVPVLHGAVVLGGILSPAPGATLYDSDNGNSTTNQFSPNGVPSTFASLGGGGIAFDAAGNLYEAGHYQRQYLQVHSRGRPKHLR